MIRSPDGDHAGGWIDTRRAHRAREAVIEHAPVAELRMCRTGDEVTLKKRLYDQHQIERMG